MQTLVGVLAVQIGFGSRVIGREDPVQNGDVSLGFPDESLSAAFDIDGSADLVLVFLLHEVEARTPPPLSGGIHHPRRPPCPMVA